MRKIMILWRNEMARITRRVFVMVLCILMVALTFLLCGGMRLLIYFSEQDSGNYKTDRSALDQAIEESRSSKQALSAELGTLSEEDEKYAEVQDELYHVTEQYEYYCLLKESGCDDVSYPDYLDTCAMNLAVYRASMQVYGECDLIYEDTIKTYEAILKDKKYEDYIALQKELVDRAEGASDEEKAIEKQGLDYTYQVDPKGEIYDCPDVDTWKNAKLGLLYNRYDLAGQKRPLNRERKQQLIDQIAICEYKFEHGLAETFPKTTEQDMVKTVVSLAKGLSCSFLLFLLLILAGSGISGDISSGAVKGLIIAPVRRSQIFAGKALALLTVGVVGSLLCFVTTTAAFSCFFGISNLPVYIYAVNGTAHALPGAVYLLARIFVDLIPALGMAAFAMMLSALTRNTAASVGISIACYYLSNLGASFLQTGLFRGEWIKFLPIQHLDLFNAFFPFDSSEGLFGSMSASVPTPSLTFSLVYLVVATLVFGYTAFDSFTRRDI